MNRCDYRIIARKADLYYLCSRTPIRRFERHPGRRDPDSTSRPCDSLANYRDERSAGETVRPTRNDYLHLIRNLGVTDVKSFNQQYGHPGLQVVAVIVQTSRSA
jgi:hypothetical protein